MSRRASFLQAWQQALRSLAREPLPPLTVITGESPFVKERLIEAAVAQVEGEVEVFAARPGEGDRSALQRLLDLWTTPTLFAGGRLLLARDVDALLKGERAAAVAAVLDGPAPPHHLLLTTTGLDGRTRLGKRVKDLGGLHALPVLRDSPPPWHTGGPTQETDLNAWLVAEARLRGVVLDLATADALTQRVGNEPGRLAQKLDQLAVLAGPERRPDPDLVARVVPHSSIRLLALYEEALQAGRAGAALELVDRMVRDGVADPFGRLVTGPAVTDTVLRGVVSNLARSLAAHEALAPGLKAALASKPWERSKDDAAALDAVLGKGGPRVFVERDLRRTTLAGTRAAFAVGLAALRALRDGRGVSLHAVSARLAAAHARGQPARRTAS